MPFAARVSVIGALESTVSVTEPVGVPEAEVTEMVKLSEAFTKGAVFDAVMVVVVLVRRGPVLAVHAVARLFTLMEPSPVTWS